MKKSIAGFYQVHCENCNCRTSSREKQEVQKIWNVRYFDKIPETDENLVFGVRVRGIRQKRQMKQRELAEQVGTSWHIINAVEAGTAQADYDLIVRLARAFNVTTDYLLGNEVMRE